MEKNEANQKNSPTGDNTELEKFKRRLIRAVARMLLHEKRNEAEVWAGLRKQTGCDCKELWNRMHALTIRKLQRLLNAQDRVDLLPKPARMSITDWLMFDTVIAHEDFDVIGMSETEKEDKKVITDLFDLVEKFKIEFLAGDQLADAWSEATIHYNKDNRQCTPMLLQRRWYQFKLATRARFYKFWSMYKGTVKRLYLAESYRPTPLQTKLAMRYKPLVVKSFMLWEELIKHKLVILPEEFELKSIEKEAKNNEIAPEVMCIEPNLETIDLDDDSDLEYRDVPQKDKQPVVTIKQEPKDEVDTDDNLPYVNRQEKISHFAEAVMEATAMELDEIELADSLDSLNGDNAKEPEKANDDDVTEIPSNDASEMALNEGDNENLVTGNHTVDLPAVSLNESNALPVNENNDIHIITEEDNNVMQKEVVLPQITSIFGGVDVSNETLSKIGLLTAQITNNVSKVIIEKEDRRTTITDSIDISSDSLDGIPVDNNEAVVTEDQIAPKDSLDNNTNMEADVKPNIRKNIWFGELSNDIEFADDGIQLMDDGIAYVDDDCALQMGDIQLEIKEEEDKEDTIVEINEEDTTPTVDEKLLMMPVVRMVKLDDMGILPIHLLQHVDNKAIIDVINSKNRVPIVKKIDVEAESSDEDTVEEIKKVKLSSALLQKPRSRTYNPIQLCKNPDFNTRLKKLNVGFFSSARNRLLLKACQPLSVDVSKAFECRLVDGTMYLEASDDKDLNKNIDLTESSQNVSVVPSAMALQSLIDNTKGEIPPPTIPIREKNQIVRWPDKSEVNRNLPPPTVPIPEKNEVISWPDTSEVNRNQRLLTAEITPLKSKNFTHVPVTIINTHPTYKYGKCTAGPASRTKFINTPVVDITKEDNVNKTSQNTAPYVKSKEMYKTQVPWKPRQKVEIPWFCNKSYTYSSDTLLALDSLNKMLCLLTEGEKEDTGKKKKKTPIKEQNNSTILVDDISASSNKDDDVQVVSETKLNEAPVKIKRKRGKARTFDPNAPKRLKPVFCCWARERICQMLFSKKVISKHNCPFPLCMCCCRHALVDYILKKKESGKNLDSEKNTAEPLGCVGLGDLTGVAAKSISNTDEAEIVPIVKKTPQKLTSDSLSTETNEEATNSANENSDDVVICNTESTQTEEPIVLDKNIDNVIEVGAETTVTTAESSVLTQTANASTEKQTNSKLNTKPAKPRIRVMSSVGPMKLLEANKPPPATSDQSKIEQKKVIVLDPISPNKMKEDVITLRRSLMPPPLKYKKVISAPNKGIPIAPIKYTSSKNPLNKKMIYLNSKLISELPTDNPIYLGKNKILLTTAKFPPNFKAFEAFQANLKQTMALPIGIQLVLLPSGRLTYIRDRKFAVSEEFIKALPHLIEAIQQQINASVVVHPNTLPDVINLSDDEIEVVESAENEKPKEINQTKSSGDGETRNDDAEPTMNMDTSISQDIVETPVSEISKDNVDETITAVPSTNNDNKNDIDIQSDENIAVSGTDITTENNKSHDTITVEPCFDNCNKEPEKNIPISESETHTTENNEKENAGTKSKNILSDLMAMSGIEPTDIATTAQEQTTELISQEQLKKIMQVPIDNQESISVVGVQNIKELPIHAENPMQTARTSTNDNVVVAAIPRKTFASSLTAITSLSELKYACAQCSSFFKLDMDTGVLHPINVCMKKFSEGTLSSRVSKTYRPKTTPRSSEPIDLTDDDVTEVVNSTQTEDHDLISIVNANDDSEASTFTIEPVNNKSLLQVNNRLTEADNINLNGVNVTSCGKVKPLKLFRSNVGRPSILGNKLKEIQKRIKDAMTTQDMIRRKLKRKQELNQLVNDEDHECMSVDSKDDTSNDSSDEEPLAKIASKMRAVEQLNAVIKETEIKEKSNENASGSTEMEVPPQEAMPNETDEQMDEETLAGDMLTEDEEDMPTECLEETLLEENDGDEDCILGV